jgi:hypothetical protein
MFVFKNLEASLRSNAAGTGTYLPMTFYTGGSERVRIDTSGNVGIGTASPVAGYRLNVVNDSGNAQQLIRAGTNFNSTISFGDQDSSTSGQLLYAHNGDYMRFDTNGSERMRIDSSGNVGIGNTAANVNDQVGAVRPLLVSKSDSATTIAGSQAAIVIGNADTTTSNTSQLTFAALTGANSTYFAAAAINCVFGARTNGQYPTGQLVFSTSTSLNSAPTEKMRIDSSGNVGIGTASPAYPLTLGNNKRFGALNTSAAGVNFAIIDGSNNLTFGDDSVNTNTATFQSRGGTIFNVNLSERMRIDSSGNVGIGGTANAYEKVQLGGTLPTSGNISVGLVNRGTVPSGSTTAAYGIVNGVYTAASAFTVANYYQFYAHDVTKGAGSAITSNYGFYCDALTFGTNNYGFYSNIASGSNRWNFYANGTADNYFAGNVGIGRTPTAGYKLDVAAGTAEVLIESTTGTNRVDANLINTSGTFAIGIDSSTGSVYGTAYARAIFATGAYPVVIFTNSTERMRIDSSGNVGIGATSFGTSAAKVLGLANATAPTTSPAGMGQLYVEAGALKYRGSSGTVTTIAVA